MWNTVAICQNNETPTPPKYKELINSQLKTNKKNKEVITLMKSIAIVYYSASGTTHSLAEAIQKGASSLPPNTNKVEVNTYRILPEHIQEGRFIESNMLKVISKADGIIFGSPTYMGSVAAQFKAFIDATSSIWVQGGWTNKVAAAFTVGSHYSGDQLSTIQYLQTLAGQHGMLWVGLDDKGLQEQNVPNSSGASSGLITYTQNNEVPKDALLTAQYLGERVAKLVNRI